MSRRAFIIGLAIIAFLIVSLYRAKYGARDTANELMAVEAEIEAARREKSLLETELAHMSRRDWIEEYAREELGMAPPKPEQLAREGDLDRLAGPVVKEPVGLVVEETPAAEAEAIIETAELPVQKKPAPPAPIEVSAPRPQPEPEVIEPNAAPAETAPLELEPAP